MDIIRNCILRIRNIDGKYTNGTYTGFWKEYLYSIYGSSSYEYEEGRYLNGKKIGVWKTYCSFFSPPRLSHESTYFLGLKNGPYKTYDPDGDIVCEGTFQNGKKHGGWRQITRRFIVHLSFNAGLMDGMFKMWNKDSGNLIRQGLYVADKKEGFWTDDNPVMLNSLSENYYSEGQYVGGKKEGEWKSYSYGSLMNIDIYNGGIVISSTSVPLICMVNTIVSLCDQRR